METAPLAALVWAKATLVWGLFVWMLLNVVNHLSDVQGTRHAVAAFMRMESLDQPPAIPTPLKRRRIESPALHTFAFAVLVLLQAISAQRQRRPEVVWTSQSLGIRVDLADKDALCRALDEP